MKQNPIILLFVMLLVVRSAVAATLTVNTTADIGPGTLRDALANAADGDTIDLTGISGTIWITHGELLVNRSVTISGPGPATLTLNGNASSRVFHIGPTHTVSISGLTMTNAFNDGFGGAIYNDHATLNLTNCFIRGNQGNSGGGIFNDGLNSGHAELLVVDCTFRGNSASSAGGAIDNEAGGLGSGHALVIGCAFDELDGSRVVFSPDVGGGVASGGPTAEIEIINCAFVNYRSPTTAGEVLYNEDGSFLIHNSTIAGGSIINSGTMQILNSTLSGSSYISNFRAVQIGSTLLATCCENIYNTLGTVTSLGFNLSTGTSGGFLNQPTDLLNRNPMLGPLQNNGGPTVTHALMPGSPAIDMGNNFSGSPYDQRGAGFLRLNDDPSKPNAAGGDGTDIGAFEAQPPCTTVVTSIADSGPGSLRGAIACAADGDIIDATGISGTMLLMTGEVLINKSVSIVGPGPAVLSLDGSAGSRVFHIAPNTVVNITGLSVANGYAKGPDLFGFFGGGIYNDRATLTVSNCYFSGNKAVFNGGAICNAGQNGTATATVLNCTLTGNSASAGAAISNEGNKGNANLTVASTTLGYNRANIGGGIRNGGEGGTAMLAVANSTFFGNVAQFGGGAIENEGCCSGSATLQLVNCTLATNSAGAFGGGALFSQGAGATANVTSCTLSGNSAESGGAIIIGDSARLEIGNTILDTGTSGGSITNFLPGTVTSLGYNLSSDQGGGFLTQSTDLLSTDPLLGPLADNGGPTRTHALLCGSPAIDKGRNFTASPYDQRGFGFLRTVDDSFVENVPGGDGTDIGAFEFQGPCLSAAERVQQLMDVVDLRWARPQPLKAILEAARASIERDNRTAAIHQLRAFKKEVRAHVASVDSALAHFLAEAAQGIIEGLINQSLGSKK